MYKVVLKVQEPFEYKGETSSRIVIKCNLEFPKRKNAIAYIERELHTRGFKDISRDYHRGFKESICSAWTGESWFNEGNGIVEKEIYNYILTKIC